MFLSLKQSCKNVPVTIPLTLCALLLWKRKALSFAGLFWSLSKADWRLVDAFSLSACMWGKKRLLQFLLPFLICFLLLLFSVTGNKYSWHAFPENGITYSLLIFPDLIYVLNINSDIVLYNSVLKGRIKSKYFQASCTDFFFLWTSFYYWGRGS